MKTVFIMRHAKSSWKDTHLADHQRPLNKRGKKAAPEMGKRLNERGVRPDAIVSSDARRAMETAASMAAMLGLSSNDIQEDPDLYDAPPNRILSVIHRFMDNWKQVIVVGHNPGLTELANRFYPYPIANIPTAGIVELGFKIASWLEIDRENLEFSSFDFPKNKSTR
jgi:phosphohistidine phosphatase